MLISEKIALLRLNPEKGRPYFDLSPDVLYTSFLVDLFLRGNISYNKNNKKKVRIITMETSNPLLNEPLNNLLTKKEGAGASHNIPTAIVLLNRGTGPFSEREIYKHFIIEVILRDETIKHPKLYFNQEDIQQNLISDIKKTTLGIDKPDVADYYVLRMLKMGHLLKRYFSKPEIKEIKELLKKDPIQIGIEVNMASLIKRIIKDLRRRNKAL